AVTAAAAGVLVLVVAVVALSVGYVAVRKEQERTAQAQQQTELALGAESRRRRQARDALGGPTSMVLEALLGQQVVLQDAHKAYLRQALKAYEEFAADTGSDAATRADIGRAYRRVGHLRYYLGEYAEAEAAYRTALVLHQQLVADFP